MIKEEFVSEDRGRIVSKEVYEAMKKDFIENPPFDTVKKPEHYHKNGMDTFTFLENGFKPEIARGFYIGNIIKYLQRAESKGGLEDYEKAYQYMKTLLAFETELKTREK